MHTKRRAKATWALIATAGLVGGCSESSSDQSGGPGGSGGAMGNVDGDAAAPTTTVEVDVFDDTTLPFAPLEGVTLVLELVDGRSLETVSDANGNASFTGEFDLDSIEWMLAFKDDHTLMAVRGGIVRRSVEQFGKAGAGVQPLDRAAGLVEVSGALLNMADTSNWAVVTSTSSQFFWNKFETDPASYGVLVSPDAPFKVIVHEYAPMWPAQGFAANSVNWVMVDHAGTSVDSTLDIDLGATGSTITPATLVGSVTAPSHQRLRDEGRLYALLLDGDTGSFIGQTQQSQLNGSSYDFEVAYVDLPTRQRIRAAVYVETNEGLRSSILIDDLQPGNLDDPFLSPVELTTPTDSGPHTYPLTVSWEAPADPEVIGTVVHLQRGDGQVVATFAALADEMTMTLPELPERVDVDTLWAGDTVTAMLSVCAVNELAVDAPCDRVARGSRQIETAKP